MLLIFITHCSCLWYECLLVSRRHFHTSTLNHLEFGKSLLIVTSLKFFLKFMVFHLWSIQLWQTDKRPHSRFINVGRDMLWTESIWGNTQIFKWNCSRINYDQTHELSSKMIKSICQPQMIKKYSECGRWLILR